MSELIPRGKQLAAIQFGLENPAAGFFIDPGFGKTAVILTMVDILKDEKIIRKTLIVGTVRIIHSVWPKEIKKWGFDFDVEVLHGKDKEKNLKKKADVYLINYEGLAWLSTQPKKLREQFDVLVLDESSKVKNFKSQRFKILKKMLPNFDRRYLLTGTPAPQSLMDLFSQIYVLDQGESLGRYITAYRNNYFYPSGFKGYQYVLQEGADKRIQKKISPLILRLEYEPDVPKRNNFIEVDLPDDVRSDYDLMENALAMQLKDGVILASNAGVATQKLRQIVNGHVRDNEKKVHWLHEAKLEALGELIDELQGTPLLVGYEFIPDLEMLLKAFPYITVGGRKIKTRHIGGGVSKDEALEIEDEWNAGRLPLFLGQTHSIAHGLNLQESGCNACFYSMTWNLEDYEQMIKRLWRRGQKKTVTVHHIMVKDSIDYDVKRVLESKSKTQRSLLNALKTRLLK